MAEYFVRPAGAHANTPDGLTYATAWLGLDNIVYGGGGWGANDTLKIRGKHVRSTIWAIGNPVASLGNEAIIEFEDNENDDPGSIEFDTDNQYVNLARAHVWFYGIDVTGIQDGNGAVVFITNANNNKFLRGTIKWGDRGIAPNTGDGATHQDLVIDGVEFVEQKTDSLRWLMSGTNFTSTLDGLTVQRCKFSRIGESAIHARFEPDQNAASSMSNILIEDNVFDQCGGLTIRIVDDVSRADPVNENLVITNNAFDGCGDGRTAAGCIIVNNFKCVNHNYDETLLIADNTINGTTGNAGPIDVFNCRGLIIERNGITNTICAAGGIDANGILLDHGSDEVIVRRNKVDTALGLAGSANDHNSGVAIMVLYGNTNFHIYGNYCKNTKHGIWLGNTTLGVIEGQFGNNIFQDIVDNGVYIAVNNSAPESVEVKNSIFTEKSGASAKPVLEASADVNDLDEDYNIFYGFTQASSNHTHGANNITEDPELTNGIPSYTSPAIGAGIKWWTGANPTDYNGEPFADVNTDIGSSQTTFNKMHPINLQK